MAHELTHVVNRDVVIMTIASFFASIASMIVQFGFFFGGGFGGGYYDDDDDDPSFMVVILVSVVVYVVSFFLMQALSRYREFAADRGAAVITGRPSALASALMKISGIDAAHPAAGPARGRRDERLLHRPRGGQERRSTACSRRTRRWRSGSRRCRASRRSCRAARRAASPSGVAWASSTRCSGARKVKGPAPDRLFAITTAYVTLETEHGDHARAARRRSSSSRWRPATSSRSSPTWRRPCAAPARRPARRVETHDDEFGYRWMILRDPDLEDLAVGVNAVSDALAVGGYGDRVLCAVFAFEDATEQAAVLHLQLQARQLVPVRARRPATQQRSTERELQLKAQIGRRAADRARARALVPALGHPDLGSVAPPCARSSSPTCTSAPGWAATSCGAPGRSRRCSTRSTASTASSCSATSSSCSSRRPRRRSRSPSPCCGRSAQRLGPEREVVVVPGNHDAALVRPWLRANGVPGGSRRARPARRDRRCWRRSPRWLAPARVRVRYPGVWLSRARVGDPRALPRPPPAARSRRSASPAARSAGCRATARRPPTTSRPAAPSLTRARGAGSRGGCRGRWPRCAEDVAELLRAATMPGVPRAAAAATASRR